MRIYEDFLDSLDDRHIDTARLVDSRRQLSCLFLIEQQKCGRFALHTKNLDPKVQREIINHDVPVRTSMEVSSLETVFNMLHFVHDFRITIEQYDDYQITERYREWSVQEFIDGAGAAWWNAMDYYDTPILAYRVYVDVNESTTPDEFISDFYTIYKKVKFRYGSFVIKNAEGRLPEVLYRSGELDFKDYDNDIIAAYDAIFNTNYEEEYHERYYKKDTFSQQYKRQYKYLSSFVRYLMYFQKKNADDESSLYKFEVKGLLNDWSQFQSDREYTLLIDIVPKDNDYNPLRMKEFVIRNIIGKINELKLRTKGIYNTFGVYIFDSGAYTKGLRDNPEEVMHFNKWHNDEPVTVEFTYLNQTGEIYPCGRKRVFHPWKQFVQAKVSWQRVINHQTYM